MIFDGASVSCAERLAFAEGEAAHENTAADPRRDHADQQLDLIVRGYEQYRKKLRLEAVQTFTAATESPDGRFAYLAHYGLAISLFGTPGQSVFAMILSLSASKPAIDRRFKTGQL